MISVVIPVYNIESLLPRCIDSVLSQSYSDFELILVDDGSSDRSGMIIDEYALKDKRIVAVHQANAGVSAARNCGLDIAKGELITFVDSDDYVTPTYLGDLLDAAVSSGAELVVSGCQYSIDGHQECRKFYNDLVSAADLDTLFGKHELAKGCCVWGRLYRKDMIGNVRFPVGAVNSEDLIFTCNYLLNINKVCFIDKINYNYEVRGGSLTKVIYPFENEVIALDQLYLVRRRLSVRYQINNLNRYISPRGIFERVIQSLYSGSYDRKERLNRLSSLRFDYADIVPDKMYAKERIYFFLLKARIWQLIDLLNLRTYKNSRFKYVNK